MASKQEQLEKQIEWARDNVPVLATFSPEAIEKIVRRANNETQSLRSWGTFAFALASAFIGNAIHEDIRSMGGSRFEVYLVMIVSGAVGVLIAQMIGNELLRRKLERLAGGI